MNTARPGSSRHCGRTARRRSKRRQGEAGLTAPQHHVVAADPVLIRLNQWLSRRGGKRVGKCALKPAVFTDTGRGLLTTRAVGANEVLVSIPKKALITCSVALADPVFRRGLQASRLSFKAQEVLTLFLLYHKSLGMASEWKPYLDSLPCHYTVPAFCSPLEKTCLPHWLSCQLTKQEEDVNTCLEKLQRVVARDGKLGQVLGSLGREEVAWGWFTVNTRAVYLPADSPGCLQLLCDEDVMALAPFLDLLNHSPAAQVTAGLNDDTRCYEVVTRRPCAPHRQAFISYGPHHNLRLLLEYGFSVPHNPHNYLPLELQDLVGAVTIAEVEDGRGNMIDEKIHLIRTDGLDQSLSVELGGVSWGVEAALTVCLMTERELREWRTVYRGGMEEAAHRGRVLACVLTLLTNKVQELSACLTSAHTLPHHTPAFTACLGLLQEYEDMLAAVITCYQAKMQTCTLQHSSGTNLHIPKCC